MSRLAYETVCEERNRLLEERDNLLVRCLDAIVEKAEDATGRKATSVEMERVGAGTYIPTVHLEPILAPEIEAKIRHYGEGDPAFTAELRSKALAMKASGMEDEAVADNLLAHFRIEAF